MGKDGTWSWPRLQDPLRCIVTGKPRNAAAGMGSRAAEEKILDGRAIASRTGNRAHEKDLIQAISA